ncbi:WecB/TagA/CpsF family glycosyltransferase [Butyrivibrio sp. AE2005]|uniref:WecB/TagA/CpsF family glycosyltransferase n=1 Tax=Butyrivibrio sp. AE2005 TaxID=1496722 RepID=UPI000A9C11F5|nr:WecB/TagA/CpsF family glycosyltransferase [Butyrivibrio sp. AE2005]
MNNYKKQRFPVKRIFIIDELALIFTMATELVMKFGTTLMVWDNSYTILYFSVTVTACVIQVIVFLLYDCRRKHIFLLDPFENFMMVVKGKFIVYAFSMMYLFAIQRGGASSRTVMGLFFPISILYSYVFRMLYRKKNKDRFLSMGDNKTYKVLLPVTNIVDVIEKFYVSGCDDMLLIGADNEHASAKEMLEETEKRGIRTYLALGVNGYNVRSGIVTDIENYAAIPAAVRSERFDVFGIKYAVARTEEAVFHVLKHLKELSGKYICFSNVHTSVMGRENPEYRDVLNSSAFTFADGNPIAKLQQKEGYIGAERVAGPDFMEHMFRNTTDGKVAHFFYGASEETIEKLRKNLLDKYPGINIVGMYSPPFRPLSEEEDAADVEMINSSGADIVWIGLGAPKQEKWMLAHKDRINGVMMGVGAGFDFHGGTIKRAPEWIRKIGLEWFYRLFQDPERLFKRYYVTNTKFICYLIKDYLNNKNK